MCKLMNDHIFGKNIMFCVYLFTVFVLIVDCRNIKPKQSEIDDQKVIGYKDFNHHINFTPCIDKDCAKHKINNHDKKHTRIHHHKTKHHRGKSRHGKKHIRKLPVSKGLTLQGEDPHVLPQKHGWNLDARVPDRVSRLENKIHQNIRVPAKQFMDNLQIILRKVQEKVRTVDNEYIAIGTKSKTAMTDVRKELGIITDENNNVYDALLDVSQLVRYVYRRAHEHGLTAPVSMSSMTYPNLKIPSLRKDMRKCQIAERNASITYSSVMGYKRRGVQQDAAKSDVMNRVKDKTLSEKFRYFEMYDLQQKVRWTLQKVDTLSTNVFVPLRRRLMKHKSVKNDVSERIQHAKYLNGLSYDSTKAARNTFQVNKKYHQRIKHDRYSKVRANGRHRRSVDQSELEILSQRVNRRIRQLEAVSAVVNSKLAPLVSKSVVVIKERQNAGAGVLSQIRNILTKITATVTKLDNKMDEIRVFLKDDKILEARCQELLTSGERKSDIIDCQNYDIVEGSGSGIDIDDEDEVFTLKSTTVRTTHRGSSRDTTTISTPSSMNSTHSVSTTSGTVPQSTTPSTSPKKNSTESTTQSSSSRDTTTSSKHVTSKITHSVSNTSTTTEIRPNSSTSTVSPKTTKPPDMKNSTASTTKTITLETDSNVTSAGSPMSTKSSVPEKPSTTRSPTTLRPSSTKPTTRLPTTSTKTSISTTIKDSSANLTTQSTKTSTTTTTTTQTTTLITEEDKITKEEGSGESESEFSFEEETKTDKEKEGGGGWLWPFGDDPNVLYDAQRDFKEKITKYAHETKIKSDEIHHHWINVSSGYSDLQERWQIINDNLIHLGSYVNLASGLKISWNTAKLFIDDKLTNIPTKALDIIHMSDDVQNMSENALKIANEKLSKMLQLKQQRLEKSTANDFGPALVAELISTVQTVNQKSDALAKLQKINPTPCKAVQNTATRLRNSIAQLRSKIDKAKTITSAIPLTVSMDGKDFVEATIPRQPLSVLPTSSIGICVKPRGENMNVATFYGNLSESYSIQLEDLKPVLKITDKDGADIDKISFDTSLHKDEWNTIDIMRTAKTIEMKINDINATMEGSVEKSQLQYISPLQPTISSAVIGKTTIAEDIPNFSGCIGDVMINGRHVAFSNNKGTIRPCGSLCKQDESKAMIFEGEGFAKFSLYLIDVSYIDEIHIQFQTMQKDGVLLFINDKLKTLQVSVALSEGSLHVEVSTRRGTTVKTSSKDTYSDGKDHVLNIVFNADNIDVKTEDANDKFEQELIRQEITSRIDDGIFLGGLAVQSHSLSGKTKLRSFSGCISRFSISKKEIPLYMIEESKNVYFGKCKENIWRKCVNFIDQSKPIKILKTDNARTIYIIYASSSIGTLLQLQRIKGEDFDITVYVDSMGLEISDNKEGIEYKLQPTALDKDFHVLSIEDNDSDSILVRIDESSLTVPYSKPWRWAWNDNGVSFDVAVGGHVTDDAATFQGGISSLIVNDRLRELEPYMEENNLHHCERLELIHLESNKEEKLVC